MPNSIGNINKYLTINHKMKHPKTWLVITLLAMLLAFMLVIIKHYNAAEDLQQKIYDHSEIKDTV